MARPLPKDLEARIAGAAKRAEVRSVGVFGFMLGTAFGFGLGASFFFRHWRVCIFHHWCGRGGRTLVFSQQAKQKEVGATARVQQNPDSQPR